MKNPLLQNDRSIRVYRGGSWLNFARYVRVSYRYGYAPSIRNRTLGFRLFRTQEKA